MIAGRRRDDAVLRGGIATEEVEPAAHLERGGGEHVLAFQQRHGPERRGYGVALDERRRPEVRPKELARGEDVSERDGERVHGPESSGAAG